MRVLMTGMTSRGIGSQRLRHDYVVLSDILARALLELGHEVDIGRVAPGECLDRYEAALVQVYWVSSLSSSYAHEAALALAELGPRATLYVDDWRAQTLGDDWERHVESDRGWGMHRGRFRRLEHDRLSPRQSDLVRETLVRAITPGCPWRMLVPQHPWGDLGLFASAGRRRLTCELVPADPTPLVPLPDLGRRRADPDRDRQWVLAAIQDHDRWLARQGLSWPVLKLGCVRKLGGGVNPGTAAMSRVVPELEVVRSYARSWGMLAPEYASAGSGWWRVRYAQAAHARAATLAPPPDALAMGGPFVVPDAASLEALDWRALGRVADAQAATHDSWAWDRGRLLSAVDRLVRGLP